MSGNFVQRGEAAALDKWSRARLALQCGADLLVELPLPWALAGVERFAFGGVSLLNALGADALFSAASAAKRRRFCISPNTCSPPRFQPTCAPFSAGLPFAAARVAPSKKALGADCAALCAQPNNILGIRILQGGPQNRREARAAHAAAHRRRS